MPHQQVQNDHHHVGRDRPLSFTPPPSLAAISLTLEHGLKVAPQATKLWFYTSRCLVVDMEWSGRQVAIDIVLTDDDDIIVKMHTRAADGHELLQRVVARTGCVLRSGKYLIARVPLGADASATGQALLGVLNNLYARSQEPTDAP